MQKIPVTRDGKRGSEVLIIDADQVLKIEQRRDRDYLVHTKEDVYYLSISLDSMEELLFENGFRMLDTTNIVNMHHVHEYEPKRGVLYFGDPNDKESKTASAARIHRQHIEHVLNMLSIARQYEGNVYDEKYAEELDAYVSSNRFEDQHLRSYATIRAMIEKKKAEERLNYMLYHDELTHLPNRQAFQLELEKLLTDLEHDKRSAAVLYLDIDRFKVINDTLGHQIGDELLRHVSMLLRENLPERQLIARFSGDEFIILIDHVIHIDELIHTTKHLLQLLSEPFVFLEQELFVSASIGICMIDNLDSNPDTIIKNADTAMYRAKEKGGNTYQFYHSEMNSRSLERLTLENYLRRALQKNEFQIYYQPLLDLDTGTVYGMEALIRWNHPERGMVSPADFIPLAEETGLIVPIGNWVMREACRQNKEWLDSGLGDLSVAVNISVNQFIQPGFIRFVKETLSETGLPPHLLCLEITENIAMKNVAYVIDTVDKLKQMGVQISIDDFGTGYSSLGYLKKFRVHFLKIDQSFIRNITQDNENAAIVTALITMSQQLNMKCLAEGVETMEELQFLKERGCDKIQGYVFSRPLPCQEFEQLLQEKRTLYKTN